MKFRAAKVEDIDQCQIIRNAVVENALSDPGLITYHDYLKFLTERGKGWVCEIEGQIVGFTIVDLDGENVWALFVSPGFEKKGIAGNYKS